MSRAEKFIQDYTRNCSNLMQVPTLDDKGNIVPEAHPWLTPEEARKAVEIAREEIYEWLLANAYNYCFCARNFEARRCIYDIKQAMKDE